MFDIYYNDRLRNYDIYICTSIIAYGNVTFAGWSYCKWMCSFLHELLQLLKVPTSASTGRNSGQNP